MVVNTVMKHSNLRVIMITGSEDKRLEISSTGLPDTTIITINVKIK